MTPEREMELYEERKELIKERNSLQADVRALVALADEARREVERLRAHLETIAAMDRRVCYMAIDEAVDALNPTADSARSDEGTNQGTIEGAI